MPKRGPKRGGRPLGVTRRKTLGHLPKRTEEQKHLHREYERYRRRKRSVVKKCKELNNLCKAKVFLLVVDEMRWLVFSSEKVSASWPPSISTLSGSSVGHILRDTSNANPHLEVMPQDRDLAESRSVASALSADSSDAPTSDSYPAESPIHDIPQSPHFATSSVE
jgi:hypothetical protein